MTHKLHRLLAGAAVAAGLAVASPAAAQVEADDFGRSTFVLLRGAGFYGVVAGLGDAEDGETVYGGEGAIGVAFPSLLPFGAEADTRLELEYRYLTTDVDVVEETVHDITFNYTEQFGRGRLRPLVGAGVGASIYTAELDASGSTFDFDETGFMVQAFAGLGITIVRNVDLELRVNYAYRMFDFNVLGMEIDGDLDTLTGAAGLTFRL